MESIRKHTWHEDLFGLATGVLLISCGIGFMEAGGLLTGGTVGLSQLFAKGTGISLSIIYILISIPFFILAIWKFGLSFATKSFINIFVLSYLVSLFPKVVTLDVSNQFAAAVIANTLAGVIIFNGVLAINHRPDLYIGRSA